MTLEEVEDLGFKTRYIFKMDGLENSQLVRKALQLTGGVISNDEKDSSGLYIEGPMRYRIKLGAYDSPIRDNVFIMRNIGHVILHTPDAKPGYYLDVIGTKEFIEATRFALAFLLPKDEMIALKGKKNIPEIAAMYEVPVEYVDSRLKYIWKDVNIPMKRYRSIKEVYAEPQKFNEEVKARMPKATAQIGDDGYKVVYDDGYVSWSPKETFEKGYVEVKA